MALGFKGKFRVMLLFYVVDDSFGVKVTPGLGLVTMILLMLVIPNPERGASEAKAEVIAEKNIHQSRSSFLEDLKYVIKK